MTRDQILDEIRRTATNGTALGRDAFANETGIRERDWSGKFWARWGDAVTEAGLKSKGMQERHNESYVFDKILSLMKRFGRFPTIPEMEMERITDDSFPSSRSITRRCDRKTLFDQLINYAASDERWLMLVDKLKDAAPTSTTKESESTNETALWGHVYLIKSGKLFRIGSTRAIYSRTATVIRQAPLGGDLIHQISTDDPEGIERYWHQRFAASRIRGSNKTSGEWFSLSASDVAAFKRRKTM
jgi:hypothetical protein